MPTATKRQESEYKFPAGEYFPAVLRAVKEKEIKFHKKDRETKAKLYENGEPVMDVFYKWVWSFDIVAGEYKGETAFGETRAEYTTREDDLVRQWSETLSGKELEVGEDLNTDDLLGLPCMVSVRHEEPRPRGDGTMFYGCAVDEVMPRTGALDDEPPF